MAKKRKSHNFSKVQIERFGTDLAALGIGLEAGDPGVEIRVDPRDEDVKRRVEMLSRYGLVKFRVHSDGDKIWRVALTAMGVDVVKQHQRGKVIREEVEGQGITAEQLEELREERDVKANAAMLSGADDHGGIEPIDLPPDAVLVTTQTLRSFQHKALEKDYSRVLTDEILDALLPNAKHRVTMAWKHTSFEGYRNVRLQIEIHTKPSVLETDQSETNTRRVICDISNRDWEMLMVPHNHKARRNSLVPGNDSVLYMQAPDWAAVRSYPVVHQLHGYYHGTATAHIASGWTGPLSVPQQFGRWESVGEPVILRGDSALEFFNHPRMVLNSGFLEQLQDAHPVIIDPEWVEIQEDWGLNEAWAYAERVVLPFDPLYLDFEGAGGTLPEVQVYENVRMTLAGCLFYRDWQTGRLVISPVGGRQWLDLNLQTGTLAGAFPYETVGSIVMGGRCEAGHPLQVTLDGLEPTTVSGAYVLPTNMNNIVTESVAIDLPSFDEQRREAGGGDIPEIIEDPWRVPGYVHLPLTPDEALKIHPDATHDEGAWMGIWARVVTRLAAKSMSILSLLDNENVEIREAELPRQQRRQIERERAKGRERGVASEIVVVRKTRYVGGKRVTDDHQIEYSHQWRVRRHEQHHGPHTRTYQAKPWLAKPCGRCGSCRRFVIESYVKGPPDKPLKDNKTYKFEDPD